MGRVQIQPNDRIGGPIRVTSQLFPSGCFGSKEFGQFRSTDVGISQVASSQQILWVSQTSSLSL